MEDDIGSRTASVVQMGQAGNKGPIIPNWLISVTAFAHHSCSTVNRICNGDRASGNFHPKLRDVAAGEHDPTRQ